MSSHEITSGNLGFKLFWTKDQAPAVASACHELVQQILGELTSKESSLAPLVQQLHAGLALPQFWMIAKTSDVLKSDVVRWRRLDESTKHLLASWIVSQDNPKHLLMRSPLLWEIYPTMVIGLQVRARIGLVWGTAFYAFDANAEPARYHLFDWVVNVDRGSCVLLDGAIQLTVNFMVSEISNARLIQLLL